jgi:hypothetical protein
MIIKISDLSGSGSSNTGTVLNVAFMMVFFFKRLLYKLECRCFFIRVYLSLLFEPELYFSSAYFFIVLFSLQKIN